MNAKISSLGHTLISQIEQISMLHFILARDSSKAVTVSGGFSVSEEPENYT